MDTPSSETVPGNSYLEGRYISKLIRTMEPKSPGHKAGHTHDILSPRPLVHEACKQSSYLDKTTYHPDQAHWTIDNLPAVLYVLRPGTQYSKSRARIRSTSKVIFGKYIREFLVLPSQISTQVEGWRLEAWWRLDRRIEAQDILDRMNPGIRVHHGIEESDLEMRRERFRRDFHVADWRSQVSINDLTRMMKKKKKGFNPVSTNSTRGITPGLIDPEKGEYAGRIPIPRVGGVHTGPQPLNFVLRGLERPVSNARVVSSPDGIVFHTPPTRKEARPAINPYQCLGSGLLPSYTPPLPSFHSPWSQKRVATGPVRSVTPSPQKRRATITGHVPIVNGQDITIERQQKATYPDAHCGLANHQGTNIFREQNLTNDGAIMTLEEYLDRNQITYDEYLCREEDGKKKEKQGAGTRRADSGKTFGTASAKGNAVDPWLKVL